MKIKNRTSKAIGNSTSQASDELSKAIRNNISQAFEETSKEQMNIVVVGHVDHGKSTLLGRLFADTNSLPNGKLQAVKDQCKKNSKVFEYAFLLDALKDEQSQGITIDSARAFFKTKKRDYIIIDAPGHIEFLKNMISGAARAEAAILMIDAEEGIRENSKRHAYMLSMLGVNQVVVCVNKMDLIDYDKAKYEKIKTEFTEFLSQINIIPKDFIGVSARDGDNIANISPKMDWFNGKTILNILDEFQKESSSKDKAFRMPVQDIYKFTNVGDSRRIVAGRIESGTITVGDKVVFLPSNKRSKIKSIERFNAKNSNIANAGESCGFTLEEQIYIKRGDIMCIDNGDLPKVGSKIKANLFWMGKNSMAYNKEYKLKIGTASVTVKLKEIEMVLNTSNLSNSKGTEIPKNGAAQCILECASPISFDYYSDFKTTGRFVIVDNYDIWGGGIITELVENKETEALRKVFLREKKWESSRISEKVRSIKYSQKPRIILLTGPSKFDKKSLAKACEEYLFKRGRFVYFLGIGNVLRGLDSDIEKTKREEHIRRFAEVSHILLDSGQIVFATASDLTQEELKYFKTIVHEDSLLTINVSKIDNSDELIDLRINPDSDLKHNVTKIVELIKFKNIIFDA